MKNTRIREAIADDIDFLQQLEQDCFAPHRRSSRKSLKNSIEKPNHHIFIAEQDSSQEQIVPTGAATVICYKHALRIYSIAVHPDFRGQGMGDFLLKYIIGFALLQGVDKISLEADANNRTLVEWYQRHSFSVIERLDDYYADGEPAYRMIYPMRPAPDATVSTGSIIVVENAKKWDLQIPGVEIISARDYLSAERFRTSERFHVLNLCNSYKAHSIGYYVSLLASARNHRILPSVMAVKDISNIFIAQSLLDDISDFIAKKLKPVITETFELTVILGKTPNPDYADLAKKLFALFEIPFFTVVFSHNGAWKVKKLSNLTLAAVVKNHYDDCCEAIREYMQKKRYRRTQLKKYKYDLAILINQSEKTPPSCPAALNNFKKAAEQVGFFVEFIGKEDYRRICEFDALFIRETTTIENHTYKFARHAYTEGLVVIDDPWSILFCSNKIYLHERLARGRIRQPASWLLTKHSMTPAFVKSLTLPLVLKLPESSFSLGVYRINTIDELHDKLKHMFVQSDLVIAQEFVESAFDWRIGVLDNMPLFACKYYMAHGHWQIYNWADTDQSGFVGRAETVPVHQVPSHILKAAVKSSALIGDGLYGVDLKDLNGQAYVIEINDNPNIDAGVEDLLLQDDLYLRIMNSFFNRIERERHQPRYVL